MKAILTSSLLAIAAATTAFAGSSITITGRSVSDETVTISYSTEDLKALRPVTYVTENPYVDGPTEFTGVLLRDLMREFDVSDVEALRLRAINDYAVSVPVTDIENYDVIIAYAVNGEPMSVREKGPYWAMYPISDHPELDDPTIHSRLIWQLAEIEAE